MDAKLIKSTKFPPEYSKKVDREKVNLEVMKQFVSPLLVSSSMDLQLTEANIRWISGQVIGILGNEDDVVIDFIFGMLEEERFVCPRILPLAAP